jgi:preprotein translocase subunit SecE
VNILVLGEIVMSCYNIRLMFAQVRNFQLFQYFQEVFAELKKVSWPNRQQTIEKTSLVVVVSILVGAYIGLLDYIYTQLTALIIK